MTVTAAEVAKALRRIKGPDLAGNIVDQKLISEIAIREGHVTFSIAVAPSRAEELEPLRQAAEKVVREMPGVTGTTVVLTAEAAPGSRLAPQPISLKPDSPRSDPKRPEKPAPPPRPQAAPRPTVKPAGVANIAHIIAVASGKGGVGKSTTAVNLALGLQALGHTAGVLDADVFGPSVPRLLGLSGRVEAEAGRIRPFFAHGMPVMSMGFMVDEGAPVVWRGPMVTQALTAMLRDVGWGALDVLVIDMPPGTGDVQLSLAQQVPLSGAVIVSTPQDLALIDARKALAMFQKVEVPILGIVENMSTFLCPNCGTTTDIFGHGGARQEAERIGVPFLGAIPLHLAIRETSDSGKPLTATAPDGEHAGLYREVAARTWGEIIAHKDGAGAAPELALLDDGKELSVTFAKTPAFVLPAELLRVMSPSAEVQGHSESQRVTVGGKRNVRIKDIRPIGRYAARLVFDDGHDTGLFTWGYLAELNQHRDGRWAGYLADLKKKGLSRE